VEAEFIEPEGMNPDLGGGAALVAGVVIILLSGSKDEVRR
jgi:hypothetical protein